EQCLLGIEVTRGFLEVGAIYVGDEAESHITLAVMTQGFVSHHRSEIGAADADIDDVANGPIRMTAPAAAADLFAKGRHALEDGVNRGHDVDTIDQNSLVCRRPQGDVEHRAL